MKTVYREVEVEVENRKRTIVVQEDKHGNRVTTTEENFTIARERETEDKTEFKREEPVSPNWMIDVSHDFKGTSSVAVRRRILGNIYVGGYTNTRTEFGATVGFTF